MVKRAFLAVMILVLFVAGIPVITGQSDLTISVELTPFEGNPVLAHGEAAAWDAGIFYPSVIYQDGLFHMFYGAAGPTGRVSTGYATSEDGFNWIPYKNNPIFELDTSIGLWGGLGLVDFDGDTWIGYVCVASTPLEHCEASHYATAPEPTGPWTVSPEPVLEAGGVLDWDGPRFLPSSFVKTTEGYVLYYANGAFNAFGMATSPDGVDWVKYNDPATTNNLYENSDPVMEAGSGWERSISLLSVRQHGDAWEMFYTGNLREIGYATSPDGINWTRFPDNPVLSIPGASVAITDVIVIDDVYYVYYTDFVTMSISVATGTVTWE